MRSRLSTLLALLLTVSTLGAQTTLWKHVTNVYNPPKTPRAELTRVELAAVRNLLRSPAHRDVWLCDEEENTDWVNGLFFSSIILAPGHKTILVEPGAGAECARGGQGSNGAMWIVEFHRSKPTLLASPKQSFGGWLYSVQPNPHSVYSDIVLGWHMSAFESDLTYFRFNGHSYNSIGSAILKFDEGGGDGKGTLTPKHPASSTR
jgi:hypothetical protein